MAVAHHDPRFDLATLRNPTCLNEKDYRGDDTPCPVTLRGRRRGAPLSFK